MTASPLLKHCLLPLLLLALSAGIAARQAAGMGLTLAQEPSKEAGEPDRVRIVLPNPDVASHVRVAERLDLALEQFVPWMETWTGATLPKRQRLVLHLHPTIESYRAALRDSGFSRFLDAGAVTLWRTRQSHVVLQPRAEDAYLEAVDFMPKLTLQLALHELVHQFSERAGLYKTEHQPLWYSEGLAEALSWRALALLSPERTTLLVDDARALILAEHRREGLFPLNELFTDAFEAAGLARRGLAYAQAGSLIRFLRDRTNQPWASRFNRFERTMHDGDAPRRRARPRWSRARMDRMLQGQLIDVPQLLADWTASLSSEPTWRMPQRFAEWTRDGLAVSSFAWGNEAVAIAPDARPLEELDLGLELRVLPIGEQDAFVVFAANRSGDERLELRLRSEGEILLAALHAGEWTTLAGVSILATDRGDGSGLGGARADRLDGPNRPGWHAVRISYDDGSVHVDYDGTRLLTATLPDDFQPAGSAWGLGTWKSALIAVVP